MQKAFKNPFSMNKIHLLGRLLIGIRRLLRKNLVLNSVYRTTQSFRLPLGLTLTLKLALTLTLPLTLQAQQVMADLHCHSLLKPFYSGMTDPWAFWEHTCAPDAYGVVLEKAADIPKFTQGNFESMHLGGVRLVYACLSPLEYEMRHPKVFRDLGKLRNTYACMAGVSPDWEFFMDKKVDYFQELLGHFAMLMQGDGQRYVVDGDTLRYDVIGSASELRAVLADPKRLGVVVSIEGGHALGEGPITQEMLDSPDYQVQVLEHLDILKGMRPIDRSGQILPFPVTVMGLNHFMWNGLGGHAKTFGQAFGLLLPQTEGINTGPTPLGERVVRHMLDRSVGRRILVDVKHMSRDTRAWYYTLLDSMRVTGDTVPVLATHVGISGSSWASLDQPKNKLLPNPKTSEWLNQNDISLFDEDIHAIAQSHGILGIMLDKYRVGGTLGNAAVDESHDGSLERRKTYVHLIVLNMMEVVDALQSEKAWDIIAIGSDYDGMISAMETYDQGIKMPDLRDDLLAYFEDPVDLWDVYPRRKVQRYMYGLSAEEIVNRVMGGNLVGFTARVLDGQVQAAGGSAGGAD
jgi:microsomal dipeptidase-like Zn-dependent dipeptidase